MSLSLENPVAQAELDHLRRITVSRSALIRIFTRGLFIVMNVISLLIVALVVSRAVKTPDTYYEYSEIIIQVVVLLMVYTVFMHFQVMFRTLGIASNTILREKQSHTWETLILTNVNARQLVLGKWLAVIYIMWKSYTWLAVLRVGASLGFGAIILSNDRNIILWFRNQPTLSPVRDLVYAIVLVILFTFANLLFTAAAGVIASLLGRVNSPGIATGQATRLGVLIVPILLFMIPIIYYFVTLTPPITNEKLGPFGEFIAWVEISILDNGSLLTSILSNPQDSVASTFVPAGLVVSSVYLVLAAVLLVVGQWIAKKQGASA